MHSNNPLILKLPKQLHSALLEVEIVATEVEIFIYDREKLRQNYLGHGLVETNFGLDKYSFLDLKTRSWIESRLRHVGFGGSLDVFTFGGLLSVLLSDPCGDFSGNLFPVQDFRIAMLGMINGAELVGLEKPNSIVDYVNDKDNLEISQALIKAYAAYLNPKNLSDIIPKYIAFYLEGGIGQMMDYDEKYISSTLGAAEGKQVFNKTNEYLVYQRNFGFVKKMIPLLEQGKVLTAVGSFHLPGEKGLVNLLRKRGYKVERVVTDGEIKPTN